MVNRPLLMSVGAGVDKVERRVSYETCSEPKAR
jgi:hypothetical protein